MTFYYVIRSETEKRYEKKTLRRNQNENQSKKNWCQMGKKRGKIGMQEGIKRWQGCGRKEQALESSMKISSAPHTGEQQKQKQHT